MTACGANPQVGRHAPYADIGIWCTWPGSPGRRPPSTARPAALSRDHEPLLAGGGSAPGPSPNPVALQLARWTQAIPAEFRGQAEEILVAAARAGADLRALAQICAEIRSRTVPPDPDGDDPALDRALFLDTTLDGAGVLRGDLTPECAAMVQAVLDALSAPAGAGDLRTRPQRATTTRSPRR